MADCSSIISSLSQYAPSPDSATLTLSRALRNSVSRQQHLFTIFLPSFLNGIANRLSLPRDSPPPSLPPNWHHGRSNHLLHHVTPHRPAPITSHLRRLPSSTFFLHPSYYHKPSSSLYSPSPRRGSHICIVYPWAPHNTQGILPRTDQTTEHKGPFVSVTVRSLESPKACVLDFTTPNNQRLIYLLFSASLRARTKQELVNLGFITLTPGPVYIPIFIFHPNYRTAQ